nr:hypothetical protein [Methyloceanibacter marginalis]
MQARARGACQHPHAAFGEAVGRVAGHRPVFVDGGHVDDPAAFALLDHLLGRELRAEKGALEINVHHGVVLIFRGVENRGARLDAGIVHHHVQMAELADRRIDQLLEVGELAHIGVDADALVAETCDFAL